MIADPFDAVLKQRVAQLCDWLADHGSDDRDHRERGSHQTQSQTSGADGVDDATSTRLASFEPAGASPTWYPASLGEPSSSGAQNRVRYAWFADSRWTMANE